MRIRQHCIFSALTAACSLALSDFSSAQTEIQWKFKAGESLKYAIRQKMSIEMTVSQGGVKLNQKVLNVTTVKVTPFMPQP